MTVSDPCALLKTLVATPTEESWLEFKENHWEDEKIGQYVAALSNAAILAGKERGFLVFGVENKTHKLVGTTISLKSKKAGGENFLNWLQRVISPAIQIDFHDFKCDGVKYAIIEIAPTYAAPVAFKGEIWVRMGENLKKPKPDDPVTAALYRVTSKVSFEQGAAALGLSTIPSMKMRSPKKEEQEQVVFVRASDSSFDEGSLGAPHASEVLMALCDREPVRTIRY